MKAYREVEVKHHVFLTSAEEVVSFTSSQGKSTLYHLDMRLSQPQSQSGHNDKKKTCAS
jgi:hypothetical protein